jgi:hypothetical protein
LKTTISCLAAACILCLAGCSTLRQITPLDKGEQRIGVEVGGPLITSLGFPMLIPMISVDYAYGITDSFTAGAAVHVTPLIFGLEGMGEVFATCGLVRQAGLIPSVSAGLDTILLSDFTTSFYALPELNAIVSWKVANALSLYSGAAVMVNFYPKTAGLPMDNAIAPGVPIGLVPSFPLGMQLTLGRFQLSAESRIIEPFTDNKGLVLSYVGLGDHGAIGVYLSASYLLGGSQ